jgi:hypothetical protein
MTETTTFKKLARCSKATDLRHLGTFFYIRKCVWGGAPHKTIGRVRGGTVAVVITRRLLQVI